MAPPSFLQIFTEHPTRVRHEARRFLVRNSGAALTGLSRGLPALARAPAEAGWGPQGAAATVWGSDTSFVTRLVNDQSIQDAERGWFIIILMLQGLFQ